MGAGDLHRWWNLRLGLFATRMFSLGSALAAGLAGLVLFKTGNSNQTFWLIGAVLVALWLGFQGGPWLIRLMEKAGLFGRVRMADDRLFLNKNEAIDLNKPMAVEARYQHSTITRIYDMRGLAGGGVRRDRKYQLGVTVLTMFIEQGGRHFILAADETSRRHGRDYSLDGLNIRKVAISFPKGPPCARLWPAALAEILTQLQGAKGYSTALSPVPDKAMEDPRQAVCPTWKTALGAAVVLIVTFFIAAGIFKFF
jgi:hypothetical protein